MLAARISAARRLPLFAARYSTARNEGSVAQSQGFNKKEKAHEDQYVRQHEQQLLAKLKNQIAAKAAELDALEKEHQNIAELAKKKGSE